MASACKETRVKRTSKAVQKRLPSLSCREIYYLAKFQVIHIEIVWRLLPCKLHHFLAEKCYRQTELRLIHHSQMANIVRQGKSYCTIKKSKEENPKNSIGKFTTKAKLHGMWDPWDEIVLRSEEQFYKFIKLRKMWNSTFKISFRGRWTLANSKYGNSPESWNVLDLLLLFGYFVISEF